jgi:hypothetical protein
MSTNQSSDFEPPQINNQQDFGGKKSSNESLDDGDYDELITRMKGQELKKLLCIKVSMLKYCEH